MSTSQPVGAADDHQTLYLARPDPVPAGAIAPPLLIRELHRQALLMVARDDLGLYTRDEVLREFDAAAPSHPAAILRQNFDFDPHGGHFETHLTIIRAGKPAADCGAGTIPQLLNDNLPAVANAAPFADAWAHTHWRPLLAAAGFDGSVPAGDDHSPAPDGVDGLLERTDLLAPFVAVQLTHAAIRQEGPSPARLSALARGYANLAMLTRFHWSTDQQVFAARSLLYGQRIVHRWPNSALSYWSLAYAQAMCGLHSAALEYVRVARRLGAPGEPIPRWAELIEPVCQFDLPALTDAIHADPRRAPLAALCAFESVEQCGSVALILDVGDATLRFNPACFQILDSMAGAAGVGPGARLTALAPVALAQALPADAARLADLPPAALGSVAALGAAVARLAAADEDDAGRPGLAPADPAVAELARSLVDAAATRAEPSLVAAGRLVQETMFAQVRRRATFITERWGWDGGDYAAAVRPLVADHPLRRYIGAFALSAADRPAALRTLVVDDVQRNMWEMYEPLNDEVPVAQQATGSRLRDLAWQHAAATAYDLTEMLLPFRREPTDTGMGLSTALHMYSPYSPMAEAARVRDHWDLPAVRAETKDWQSKYTQQPATLAVLGRRLAATGDRAGAEAVLERYAQVAGDYSEAATLADLYLQDGDEARWLATLEAAIRRPDYGLNHAQAQVKIARHFMDKRDYKRALPYADEAEQTQAFWAMKCDAECHRAMGDTATTDRIMAAAREHYGHD